MRSFVFLISFFTIFASFFLFFDSFRLIAFYTPSFFIDVIDIWLSIKKFFFFYFARIKITNLFFIKKSFDVFKFSNQFFQLFAKENVEIFRNIVLRKCECNACTRFEYFWYFLKNSNNCVFNFSICVINLSIDWLNFCLTCFNF